MLIYFYKVAPKNLSEPPDQIFSAEEMEARYWGPRVVIPQTGEVVILVWGKMTERKNLLEENLLSRQNGQMGHIAA